MITEKQLKLLNTYKDRSYIYSLLCNRSYNHYSKIKTITNIPLILINSIMVIINSIDLHQDTLKIPNIIINSLTTLLLSLIHNYKIDEKIICFKNSYNSFNKLCHTIEDYLINKQDDLNNEIISNLITQYDNIQESIIYNIPSFIEKDIKKKYENQRSLPLCINNTSFINKNINTPISAPKSLKVIIPNLGEGSENNLSYNV